MAKKNQVKGLLNSQTLFSSSAEGDEPTGIFILFVHFTACGVYRLAVFNTK
jgi:phosphatidylserine synthase